MPTFSFSVNRAARPVKFHDKLGLCGMRLHVTDLPRRIVRVVRRACRLFWPRQRRSAAHTGTPGIQSAPRPSAPSRHPSRPWTSSWPEDGLPSGGGSCRGRHQRGQWERCRGPWGQRPVDAGRCLRPGPNRRSLCGCILCDGRHLWTKQWNLNVTEYIAGFHWTFWMMVFDQRIRIRNHWQSNEV